MTANRRGNPTRSTAPMTRNATATAFTAWGLRRSALCSGQRDSAGVLAGDHGARCREKDLDVVPDGIAPGVAKVESNHLVERRAAAAAHLPQPGQSRLGPHDAAS